MPNILAGSINGKFGVRPHRDLQVLSLIVNNRCNLGCRHCYFQAEKSTAALTAAEWLQVLDSVYRKLEPVTVTFAGREIFALAESVELFSAAIERLRQLKPHRRTEIGVITNGTLLQPYHSLLLSSPPDYIDVSIDGLPAQHDAIRGKGAFQAVAPELHWLQEHFGNLWLTPTLNSATVTKLPELIAYYRKEFGSRRFSVGFYVPLIYTDLDLSLTKKDYELFVTDTLVALEKIKGVSDVEIIIELDQNQKGLIHRLEVAGYLRTGQAISSEDFILDNGLTLTFNVARMPVGLWRSVRLSADGGWIAAEDMLRITEYDRLATAWVREQNYDAEKLYQAGLASERFQELLRSSPSLQSYYSRQKKNSIPGRVQQTLA